MEKIYTYVIIFTGLMIFLSFAGLQTVGSVILEQFGVSFENIHNFRAGTLFVAFLVSGVAGLAASGIIIGTLGRGSPELGVTALYATPLIAMVGDMISIVVFGGTGWEGMIIFAIMSPLMVGYTIALYDWIRGKD